MRVLIAEDNLFYRRSLVGTLRPAVAADTATASGTPMAAAFWIISAETRLVDAQREIKRKTIAECRRLQFATAA